ncbi:MAG: hypothetical protein J0I06_09340 [Planctomycetes bacterium]|nr:hypothetical protein [Planctomycetota bacterium]
MATATTQFTTEQWEALTDHVKEGWHTAYLRVRGAPPAVRLWDWVLTEEEKQRLGGELDTAYARHRGAVGMWMHLHGVSLPQAVVAVALAIGFLDAATGRKLLGMCGELISRLLGLDGDAPLGQGG